MRIVWQTLRTLLRDRGYTTLALGMLTLGIGATAAVFSILYGVVLKPLTYREPDRLYFVYEQTSKLSERYPDLPVNARHFDAWRDACKACESLALISPDGKTITGYGEPVRIETLNVTEEFLPTLGLAPILGRDFTLADTEPGAPEVMLLSHAFWQEQFQGDPSAVGREVRLDDRPTTVIGVLAPALRFEQGGYLAQFGMNGGNPYVIRPLRLRFDGMRAQGRFNFGALVRLRGEATPELAQEQMNAAMAGFELPPDERATTHLVPMADEITRQGRLGIWLLFGAVGALLLIVAVNLGNLMFVRAERRQREAAIRRALGASTARLLGSMLAEGVLLAVAGAAMGTLAAYWALDVILVLAPNLPRSAEIGLHPPVLLFTICAAMTAGVLASALPAMRLAGVSAEQALRESQASSTSSRRRLRTRNALVASEVALSVVLLAAAGLLGASFFRLMGVDKGFATEESLTFRTFLPAQRYPESADLTRFNDELLRRLQSQPGVRGAAVTSRAPMQGETWVDSIEPEGESLLRGEALTTNYRFVDPSYLPVMSLRLREGRFIEAGDRERHVAVISTEAAKRAWGESSPIGRRFRGGPDDSWRIEVVGVVDDVRTGGLDTPPVPTAYLGHWEDPPRSATFVVRTTIEPAALVSHIRETVRDLDSELAIFGVQTLDEVVSGSMATRRFETLLALLFAIAALCLACLGIYGVVAYAVAQRTREIGLRMALGADSPTVRALVLREGMAPVFAGLALGLAAAVAGGRLIESLLFEVSARDPAALLAVTAVLLTVALLACYVPARRAARIQPITALRYE